MSTSLGWKGNRRSGVTLAMCHRHSGLSTCGFNGLWKGDEHPAYAPSVYGPLLPLSFYWTVGLLLSVSRLGMLEIYAKNSKVLRTWLLNSVQILCSFFCVIFAARLQQGCIARPIPLYGPEGAVHVRVFYKE